ncbi:MULTISPECIES: AAA family ATPase [unclassified Exiguobacterium]|uniref:AAA family ATPase n=1 Tax=unclassified Exiguobacterium TaxID=2644629 RepID=UPI001BECD47C|nr:MULTISPECIES: AAA family ATPase [unclassified Exiguobacterium]
MARLDKITLQGYKSIKELELELKSINVLIGPNGAGKSNFISFFKLLNDVVNESLQNSVAKAGGADSLMYFGVKNTDQISFKLSFGQNSYSVNLKATDDSKLYFDSEYTSFQGVGYSDPLINTLGNGHFETELVKESKRAPHKTVIADYIIRSLKKWKVYHFHDTSDSSKIKQTCRIDDNEYFKEDGSNLASFLYYLKLKHENNYTAIVNTVQLVAPFIKDFDLNPSKLNEEKIRLKWRHKHSNDQFDVSQLSDGTLRFICISVLMLQPNLPDTVILDEPELGLHPFAINLLASLFKSMEEKTQLIISTQSLMLMDNFELSDIVIVDYMDNSSVIGRLNEEDFDEWLEEYSLGELWEKNILGGRPK